MYASWKSFLLLLLHGLPAAEQCQRQDTSATPLTTTPTTSTSTTGAPSTSTPTLASSSSSITSAPTAMNKILTIEGSNGKTTLVSLDGKTANCDLKDYPARSNYPAAVTYNNGEVLACGGRDLEDADRCWSFNGSTWSSLPNSKQKHCWHESQNVLVNDGWWITSRLQTKNCFGCPSPNSTSDIYTGSNWKPGPALPGKWGIWKEYPEGSCVVNLNTTHTFLIGGGYPISGEAWLYDWSSQAWTRTGSLIQGRKVHGCVSLGGQGILVAGGLFEGLMVYTVELYDPAQGTWSSQPDLPQNIDSSAPILLNWDGQVLALFQGEDQIYKRSGENREWSVLDGVRLPIDFEEYFEESIGQAVLVPGNWSCNPEEE